MLDRDIAVAMVEDNVEPYGRLEDAATHKAGLELVDITGVDERRSSTHSTMNSCQTTTGPMTTVS